MTPFDGKKIDGNSENPVGTPHDQIDCMPVRLLHPHAHAYKDGLGKAIVFRGEVLVFPFDLQHLDTLCKSQGTTREAVSQCSGDFLGAGIFSYDQTAASFQYQSPTLHSVFQREQPECPVLSKKLKIIVSLKIHKALEEHGLTT